MRAISKFAPRNNESDLTCRKWRQGCGFQPFFAEVYKVYAKKRPQPNPGPYFVQACSVEMHMDISEEAVYARNSKENASDQNRGAHLVRSCAIEMNMDSEFTAKMPRPRERTLI